MRDRYIGFQAFMLATETSLLTKIVCGMSVSKTDRSGHVLVEEGHEEKSFARGHFLFLLRHQSSLRHFPESSGPTASI